LNELEKADDCCDFLGTMLDVIEATIGKTNVVILFPKHEAAVSLSKEIVDIHDRQKNMTTANGTRFYLLRHKPMWGDYGSVLIAGMRYRQSNDYYDRTARLAIERTGPHVPSITLPDRKNIVVSDSCRELIVRDFPDFAFKPVHKERIVFSEWEDWDWDDHEPDEYPSEGEPASYILDQPHSVETSDRMGDLWEIPLAISLNVAVSGAGQSFELKVLHDSWNGEHVLLGAKEGSYRGNWIVVTSEGREFLREYDRERLLSFHLCK